MDRLKQILTILFVVAVIAAYMFWSDKKVVERRTNSEEEREVLLQELSDFANSHNAETEWRKRLPRRDIMAPLFSIDLENALVLPDAKPVMFIATLEDARKFKGNYFMVFKSDILFGTFGFELECVGDQIEKILDDRPEFMSKYAVVGEMRSVTKLSVIESDGYGMSHSSNDLFRVTGNLISFKQLGSEAFSLRFNLDT